MFLHVCVNMKIKKLQVMDITAAYLQSDDLEKDVFIKMPKDMNCEGKVARLVKPLYGLTDSGRRFFCTMRQILLVGGFQVLTGDSSTYYKRENGELVGMVITHVDDFNVGGTSKFVDETTDLIKRNMTVSKVEDDRFRFCGVDVRLTEDKEIVISMEDYAEALQNFSWQMCSLRRRYVGTCWKE